MGFDQNRCSADRDREARFVGRRQGEDMIFFFGFGAVWMGVVRVGRVRRFRFGRVRGVRRQHLGRWPVGRWRWICGIFCEGLGFGRFLRRFWLGARLGRARREVERSWGGRKGFERRGDSGLGLLVGVRLMGLGVVWFRPRRRRGC